jgi:ABC-type phosphate transport system substrate-binding protein
LIAFITDPAGDQSYPIVTYTWLLTYDQYQDPDKAQVLEDFIAPRFFARRDCATRSRLFMLS